jgi:imidazolonepropionase-like amidohydrolase
MRPVLPLLLYFAAELACAQDLGLVGATLYDGQGGRPLPNAVIVVKDGRIACVGPSTRCRVAPGVETVDLTGRFVTPGLVDAHVHYSQTGWLDGRPDAGIGLQRFDFNAVFSTLQRAPGRWNRAYLCSGVTAVFDVGGFPWTVGLAPDSGAHTERPHYRAAGQLVRHDSRAFTAMYGREKYISMRSDEDAIASVRQLANSGAAAVKVYYLDPGDDQREALAGRVRLIGKEARALGLPMIVHATELKNAKQALRAGANMLVHSVDDEVVDDEFIRLARAAGTIYVPTLLVGGNWARAVASVGFGVAPPIDDPNGCVDAETRRVIAAAPELQATLTTARADPKRLLAMVAGSGSELQRMSTNLHRVYSAGVPVATGTDAGNPLTLHGPSIYAEMEAMESAGIAPGDVLVMSTRNGALAMGRDDFGTVESGKRADLIVLTQDPGVSSRAFRSITHVVRGGVLREVGHFAAK